MRLLAAPGVGLEGTLAFHADPAVTEPVVTEPVARVARGRIFNTSPIKSQIPNTKPQQTLDSGFGVWGLAFPVLQSRAPEDEPVCGQMAGFGLLTKFSTPVENTVEKRAIGGQVAQKTRFLAIFKRAKAQGKPVLGHTSPVEV
jgi:hypothetical protein